MMMMNIVWLLPCSFVLRDNTSMLCLRKVQVHILNFGSTIDELVPNNSSLLMLYFEMYNMSSCSNEFFPLNSAIVINVFDDH